jgi:hypothetical protein
MAMPQRQRFVAAALVVLVTGAVQAGCGDDPAQQPQISPTPSVIGAGEVSDDFFTEPTYLGQTVTVTATVTAILGPTSFVVGGDQYGDESLLIVSAPGMEIGTGDQVRVTGSVERFGYGVYAERFGLAEDATDYVPFEGEEFLVASAGERLEPDSPSGHGG